MGNEANPGSIDINKPSVARMYDYYLGGEENFASDREACAALDAITPDNRAIAVINRRFLNRVVRKLAREYGVRQFIDHGSGLPTQQNVHEVAQSVTVDARVIYIDNDPIISAHGSLMLDERNTRVLELDLADTAAVFAAADEFFDASVPTAALFVSVLHCLKDEEGPGDVMRRTAERLGPGNYVAVSHLVSDDPEFREATTRTMLTNTAGNWGRVRSRPEVDAFFDGMQILDPGTLVDISTWHSDTEASPRLQEKRWYEYGGLCRTG